MHDPGLNFDLGDTIDSLRDAVRATQARVYRADEALALGLIDAVKTPTEAVAAFVAELAEDEVNEVNADGSADE